MFYFIKLIWWKRANQNYMKIKLQMNEHEISVQVSNNPRIQIVQLEFTTWKYKVKLNAEAASRAVLWKSCIHRKAPVLESLFNKVEGILILRSPILISTDGCLELVIRTSKFCLRLAVLNFFSFLRQKCS